MADFTQLMSEFTQREITLCNKLRRHAGNLLLQEMADPRTVEVMLNPDGKLWRERLGEQMVHVGEIPYARAQGILETVAGFHNLEVLTSSPSLEAPWPLDGSRFAGQLPPIVARPTFAIRKKAIKVYSLSDYVESGIMTERQKEIIIDATIKKKNILVVGGTSSGKTTLVNAIIGSISENKPNDRILTFEDTPELQVTSPNYVSYLTTVGTDMARLLRISLRMRPDRLCLGETRGPETLQMLMAWNTGHPGGAATIHADSAYDGLMKAVEYVSMNPNAPRFIEPLVGKAVDVAVFICKTETGRQVKEILSVDGYDTEKSRFNTTTIY